MIEAARAQFRCDTSNGPGFVYMYDKYLEWIPRDGRLIHLKFVLYYSEMGKVEVIPTRKAQININYSDGNKYSLMLYDQNVFTSILEDRIKHSKDEKPALESKSSSADEDLEKLMKLSALHKEGSLSDEEFALAKAKILGK